MFRPKNPTFNQNREHCFDPRKFLLSLPVYFPPYPRDNHFPDFLCHCLVLPILGLHRSGIIQYVFFCIWLLSFSFWDSSVLLLMSIVHSFWLLNSILLYGYTTIYYHDLVEHLSWFQFGALRNKVDQKFLVHIFLWISVFI